MKFKKIRARKVNAWVLGSFAVLFVALTACYFSGMRLAVWTPSNYAACSNTLDVVDQQTPTPMSELEKQEFEKYCPSVFWGEVTITRPSVEKGVEQVMSWQFWRPYWGYIWPDNNLGKFAPVQRPQN